MAHAASGRRCAVVGHPVRHSLSPALHNAAYRRLGLDWRYTAIDVEPGGFDAFVAGLDRDLWRGLSVTMPHKPDVARCGVPDEAVRLTGVANTLVLGPTPDEDAVANTDVTGFVLALNERGIDHVGSVTLVGNGATARSALAASARLGAVHVTVTLRRPERAGDVLDLTESLDMAATVLPLGEPLPASDLLVSTIPADAAAPHASVLTTGTGVVFDVIYDPWPTPLAERARARGAVVLNGLDLLAAQALDQVRMMTAGFADASGLTVADLRAAGMTELRRRARTPAPTLGD